MGEGEEEINQGELETCDYSFVVLVVRRARGRVHRLPFHLNGEKDTDQWVGGRIGGVQYQYVG